MEISQKELKSIFTGFKSLDAITGGLQYSGLHVLAGAPGMGKTTLALNILRNVAVDYAKPVGFISLEMTIDQVNNKLIAADAELDVDKINRNNLQDFEQSKIEHEAAKLIKSKIHIEAPAKMDIDEFSSKSYSLVKEEGVEFIVLDDIQRIHIDEKARNFAANREQEISSNVRAIKTLSRELGIPILTLSQVNRQVMQRHGEKKPQLHDLRDSGVIENDADTVIFLYRPEYYGITEDIMGNPEHGIAYLIVAKHRFDFSSLETKLLFKPKISKFCELDNHFNREKLPNAEFLNKNQSNQFWTSINNKDSKFGEDDIVPF